MKYIEILTENQLKLVGYSFILGLIFGASYDIIRITYILCGLVSYRGEKPGWKKGVLPFSVRLLLDFFWTAAIGLSFSIFLYAANDGEFRWFTAAFCGAGFAVWHATAGRVVVFFSEKIAAFIRTVVRYTVVLPVSFVLRLTARGLCLFGRAVRRLMRATVGKLRTAVRRRLLYMRALRRTERVRRALAEDVKFGFGGGDASLKGKSIFRNMFVRISILVLIVFFIVSFIMLQLKQNDLMAEAARIQAEIDRTNEYINKLQAEIDRPFDEEYVAEIAHEKLGLRFPQEIVFYSGDEN